MAYILTGLLSTACENSGQHSYDNYRKLVAREINSNEYAALFKVTVNARDWKRVSDVDRFVDIDLPAITSKIIKEGTVIIYLNEMQKNVSLPFTYYQVRRAISFQPSYGEGHAYVNVLGSFILNVSTSYSFHILVINKKGLKRKKLSGWQKYEEALAVLNLKTSKK